jgi:hypothetical protein
VTTELAITRNSGKLTTVFDPHVAGAIWRDAHCPMERICGFMQSHYMPPSGKGPRRIAPASAIVNDFE